MCQNGTTCLYTYYCFSELALETVRLTIATNKARESGRVRVIVLNATFNNISFISWWSVVLVEETGLVGENQ